MGLEGAGTPTQAPASRCAQPLPWGRAHFSPSGAHSQLAPCTHQTITPRRHLGSSGMSSRLNLVSGTNYPVETPVLHGGAAPTLTPAAPSGM